MNSVIVRSQQFLNSECSLNNCLWLKARCAVVLAILLTFVIPSAFAQKEPLGGQPALGAKPSVDDLQSQVDYQRAFEAVVWSAPAVAIYRMRAGAFSALGADNNVILACSIPAKPNIEALTANNVTPYIAAYTDLRKGPAVLEVPAKTERAALYGQIVGAWQTSIADVGPSGADKGAGGKYLLLPPGYEGQIPSGYLPIKADSYRIALAFRSIQLGDATQEDAYKYSKTLKMYYLSEAANPPQQRFLDPCNVNEPKRYPTLPYYDISRFQDLYDIVSVEPIQTRDKVMMGMLATIGIAPGKPYNPDAKAKAAMERAAVDAYFYLEQKSFEFFSANLYWPDRHWASTLLPDPNEGFGYETKDAILLDQRGFQFFVGTYYPEKLVPGRAATMYMGAIADSKGQPLAAGKNYRLHVPKEVPAKQFWALTVYDAATWAFIYSPQEKPGLTSFEKSKMKMNSDGSVDLYMGPTAPQGLESNWVPTSGKRPYPIFRFYGPEEAFWNKSFVLPDFEPMD